MDKPRNPSRLMNSLAVFAFLILFPQVCEVRRLASPQDSGIELEYESSATKVILDVTITNIRHSSRLRVNSYGQVKLLLLFFSGPE